MQKEESQMLKGVAILLMLWLHLFNNGHTCLELCDNLIFIGGVPLANILSRATNPVDFYLVLGGYGLYVVWQKGDRHRFTRIAKLMLHYWVVLAVFVTIGHFLNPQRYPGSFIKVLCNMTGYATTYNGEMWFLLPYVVLSLLSPWLFRFCLRFRIRWIVVATFFINLCTSFCISRYGAVFFYTTMWAYNPLLVFHILFSFMLGAMAARYGFFERVKLWMHAHFAKTQVVALGGVAALFLIKCAFKYLFGYAFFVITLLSVIRFPRPLRSLLLRLGHQSMNMWMIHTWFCYYLFSDFVYSFSYPVVIFIVLAVLSYISGVVIDMVALPLERLLLPRRQTERGSAA